MQQKGLLFDFDGTLYGDWRLWVSTIQETLSEFNIAATAYEALEKARDMIKQGTFYNISGVAVAMAREQGLDGEAEVRSRFLEKLDRVMDTTGPGKNMVSVLEELERKSVLMGIVTFQHRARLEHRLEAWNLKNYFKSIVTPDQHSEFKPSPAPFLAAIKELDISTGRCQVVGDEPVDMIGGRRAGAETIGLPQGFFSEEELRQAGADHIISSLTELPTLIQ